MNLLADVAWEYGYFYTTGGNTTENNDYDAYQYRTVEPIPVTPGTSFKYTLKLPYPRDASTGLTTGPSTDGAVVFGEYDSSGAWVQRIVHMQSGGTVSGGYEYFEGEYQASENAHGLRVYIRTYKFVIGGGDLYGNSDTYETACFKLGYIDGWMRRLFGDRYYPAVGNHDTNQQGVDETGGTWTGILSKETVRNL